MGFIEILFGLHVKPGMRIDKNVYIFGNYIKFLSR